MKQLKLIAQHKETKETYDVLQLHRNKKTFSARGSINNYKSEVFHHLCMKYFDIIVNMEDFDTIIKSKNLILHVE